MGISQGTALEIFTNPQDLLVVVGQERGHQLFSFGIFRGPRHSYKALITFKPFAETVEVAIAAVENLLNSIIVVTARELEDPNSLATVICNPRRRPIKGADVLNADWVTRILAELRRNQSAETHKMS